VKILVCRCEDVPLEEITHVLDRGFVSVEECKRLTGLGTGPCQGKECMLACALLCHAAGGGAHPITPFTARPPLSPTPLGALATALTTSLTTEDDE